MAYTRKFLDALNIPEAQQQALIDEHLAGINGLKSELDTTKQEYNDTKAALDKALKELGELKNANWQKQFEDLQEKYNKEAQEHNALKEQIAGEKTKTAKTNALKAYYEGKGIKDSNLKIALMATDMDKISLDDEGNISDVADLDALVEGDFKSLVDTGSPRIVDSGASFEATKSSAYDAQLFAAAGVKKE